MAVPTPHYGKRQAPWLAGLAALCLAAAPLGAARSADFTPSANGAEIAVTLPLSGGDASFGQGTLQGVQLAIEEANAEGSAPRIDLVAYDDQSRDETAKEIAGKIVASRAILTIGPANSSASLVAGPVYANAGMVALTPTAAADSVTRNPTTFRVDFPNGEQGEMLATYLVRVLGGYRAAVIVGDNEYGRTLRAGFERAAGRLQLDAQYFLYESADDSEGLAQQIAADASQPAIVFLTFDAGAARMLTALRRLGAKGPFLGSDAVGDESFGARLAYLPEEKRQRGYFTDGLYAISPMILDSANAGLLAFAARFRARFGGDPPWFAAAGYDTARLAAATVRAVAAGGANPGAERGAALAFLLSLKGPAQAVPGVLGPLWFDETHGRQQAIRIGRFNRGRFESAPLQIVPVTAPDPAEIASGAVFEMSAGRYARLQRVIYTGMFLNEISRVDLSRSSFAADFYLWLRFARDAGPNSPDPTDINFPNLMSGNFDRAHPAVQRETAAGIEYRLWRVQGEFRNDFDLHRFPFDRQTLSLPFFNARAAVDQVVYVLDKRAAGRGQADLAAPARPTEASPVSLAAFRNLTQWMLLGVHERRENLVTESGLGDPSRVGAESYRELSGFLIGVEMERRTIATLAKTLPPLLLMTLIMFASLYFPPALVKEKVTVAITGALSGAVLLGAINSQLGGIGYTIAVEYVFYVFFCLCLLCVVCVLGAERLRASGKGAVAVTAERWTRATFILAVAAIALAAIGLSISQSGSP